jgi:beta-lactamase regulating signal transducer with metallopeptidase domain
MFALRGAVVSLSTFAAVYCVFSLGVRFGWTALSHWCQHLPARRTADLLFAVRMFPFIAATLVTAAFTVPSFLLLEPRAIDEPLGVMPLALGVCGTGFVVFGLARSALALLRASRMTSAWKDQSELIQRSAGVPVLRIAPLVPAMTATGIVRPRILLSHAAESLLGAGEFQAALNHELEHVRRRDNLKKLLLRLVAFPGMRKLELAWLEAAEMAADDAAVSSASEALDLAAALIKLARLGCAESGIELTTALVHHPASAMSARVHRLIEWREGRRLPSRSLSPWYATVAVLTTAAVFSCVYSNLLTRAHEATEWLVR